MASVLNAQYHLNRNFTLRGYVSLNEFYEFLGIEKVVCGEGIGWGQDLLEDGIFWIDFDKMCIRDRLRYGFTFFIFANRNHNPKRVFQVTVFYFTDLAESVWQPFSLVVFAPWLPNRRTILQRVSAVWA